MKFTVEGVVNLQDSESVIVKTNSGHRLYILFAGDKLTISNESQTDGNRYIVTAHDDGSVSVIDDISGDDLL